MSPAAAIGSGSHLDVSDCEIFVRTAAFQLKAVREVHTFCLKLRWCTAEHEAQLSVCRIFDFHLLYNVLSEVQ